MTARAVQIRREPGHRLPEYILPTDRDNPMLWSDNSSSILTRAAVPGVYANNDIPRTGTIEYPLILVDFIDCPFTLRGTLALLERYEKMFNEQGYTDTIGFIHIRPKGTPITGRVQKTTISICLYAKYVDL